ncbi:putative membrane protein (plasmid) [Pseudomonas syringae pv. avii]|uniref:Membrane protein n=1 Tax=Pseudomonas syringae pv. avii TaxID=663959 RepID=A0ABY1UG96_PSESX|nr:putative membrane protein [Pseudomonas syringae pv. avii]
MWRFTMSDNDNDHRASSLSIIIGCTELLHDAQISKLSFVTSKDDRAFPKAAIRTFMLHPCVFSGISSCFFKIILRRV